MDNFDLKKYLAEGRLNFDPSTLEHNPEEIGRFSMYAPDGGDIIGIMDLWLDNTYSEKEFSDNLSNNFFEIGEFHDVADSMGIDVNEVPVYTAKYGKTDRTIKDYSK